MLVRAFLDEKRRGRWRVRLWGSAPDRAVAAPGSVSASASGAADDRTVLRAALAKVPPGQQAVLVLRFLCDRPVGDGVEGWFEAKGLRFGWLYGAFDAKIAVNGKVGRDMKSPHSAIWRYEPRSRTWQKVVVGTVSAQLGPGYFLQENPKVIIGPKVVPLPRDEGAAKTGRGTFGVTAVSADGRTVVGNAESNQSDPSVPIQPLIWRCE